jgi:ABC-type lipopolysaccharide export system ATPase subunit
MEQRPGNSKSNSNYDQAENLENLLKHAAAAEDGEKKEQQMSQATKNKVEAAKAFLESNKYSILNFNIGF